MLLRRYCSSLRNVPEAVVPNGQPAKKAGLASVFTDTSDLQFAQAESVVSLKMLRGRGEVEEGTGGTWVWSTAAKAGGDEGFPV